jgi:hypothetical protein
MSETKQINIVGTTNRYMIKKVVQSKESPKKRVVSSNWNLSEIYFQKNEQLEMLYNLQKTDCEPDESFTPEYKIMISQIEKKINSYKQQDYKKDKNNDKNNGKNKDKENKDCPLITLKETIQKLTDCELQCFYCKEDLYILYELVREMKQWSLDRIDNNKTHSCENVVISCLDCNLKRRCRSSDKFLFSKQMKIVRENIHDVYEK